jgi:hypothetical protein
LWQALQRSIIKKQIGKCRPCKVQLVILQFPKIFTVRYPQHQQCLQSFLCYFWSETNDLAIVTETVDACFAGITDIGEAPKLSTA